MGGDVCMISTERETKERERAREGYMGAIQTRAREEGLVVT